MNQPVNKIETLLARSQVAVPASLKSDVESAIEESLRAATRRDDLRWLSISFGILVLSISLSWALVASANRESRDLSNSTLTTTEDGHRIAKFLLSQEKLTSL